MTGVAPPAAAVQSPTGRVLLLLTTPAWRGSGVSFAKIARGLAAAGHQVTVVAASAEVAEGLSAAGVPDLHQLDLPNSSVGAARRLARLHRAVQSQLVLADSLRDLRLAGMAGLRSVVWRFNLHRGTAPDDLIARWQFRHVRHLVAQSHAAAALAHRAAPRQARRGVTVIPNGYDLDLLRPDAARGAAWRDRFCIPREAPLLVTVGALAPEKALQETLALGERLAARLPDLRQVLVGAGPAGQQVTAPGLHCQFTGALSAEDTRDALRAADMVVQLSPREMFPNAVAEAMALERVVLAPASGAAPEVVGDAGLLLPLDAIEDQVAAVERLLLRPGERLRLGEAARARIAAHFPLDRMVAAYDVLVRNLLSTPSRVVATGTQE